MFGCGCIGCESVFSEVTENVTLSASIDWHARLARTGKIIASMMLPIALDGVLDCGVVAAEFAANGTVRPAEISE